MNLKDEFLSYKLACYGNQELPEIMLKETEQAFISGVLLAFNRPVITKRLVMDVNKQGKARLIEIGALSVEELK